LHPAISRGCTLLGKWEKKKEKKKKKKKKKEKEKQNKAQQTRRSSHCVGQASPHEDDAADVVEVVLLGVAGFPDEQIDGVQADNKD